MLASLLFVCTLLLFSACEDPADFGEQVLPESEKLSTQTADSFQVDVSTARIKPLNLDRTGFLLLGRLDDEHSGRTVAESFFQLNYFRPNPDTAPYFGFGQDTMAIPQEASFVGAKLEFALETIGDRGIEFRPFKDGHILGDTTQNPTVEVFELAEGLIGDSSYLSDEEVPVRNSVLDRPTISIRRAAEDTMVVLDIPETGRRLFELFQGQQVSTEEIRQQFKGLALKPGPTMNAILRLGTFSVDPEVQIKLLYRHPGFGDTLVVDSGLTATNSSVQFTHIANDPAGSTVAGLVADNDVKPSTETANLSVVQGLTSYKSLVRFPDLRAFARQQNLKFVSRAELIITPQFTENHNPPPGLFLTEGQENGNIAKGSSGNQLTVPNESNGEGQPNSGPNFFPLNEGENRYRLNVTPYINRFIQGETDNPLLIGSASSRIMANRLVFGDQQYEKGKIKLKIYYGR